MSTVSDGDEDEKENGNGNGTGSGVRKQTERGTCAGTDCARREGHVDDLLYLSMTDDT